MEKQWIIYIIQENHKGCMKIGHTNNLPDRLKSLQSGNPKRLSIVYSEECSNKEQAIEKEKLLHEFYRMYSLVGEWFDCPNGMDHMITMFEKYGCVSYLRHSDDECEHFPLLAFELRDNYKELLNKLINLVNKDIQSNEKFQVTMLSKELKLLSYRLMERIINRHERG